MQSEPDSSLPTGTPPCRRRPLARAVGVVVAIEVGLVLLTLPWTGLWTQSLWLRALQTTHPEVWEELRSASLRGAVSGLGLINLWIAASEIVPFRW